MSQLVQSYLKECASKHLGHHIERCQRSFNLKPETLNEFKLVLNNKRGKYFKVKKTIKWFYREWHITQINGVRQLLGIPTENSSALVPAAANHFT